MERIPIPKSGDVEKGKQELEHLRSLEQREQKEQLDALIVFGGGVKPVLFPEELTEEQKRQWEAFQNEPQESGFRHSGEPGFRVVEARAYLQPIEDIRKREDLTPEDTERLIEEKRVEAQQIGRLALGVVPRMRALAAGYELVHGKASQLVLTGGRTAPAWVREQLSERRVRAMPSEAELMKDLIVRRFGESYQEKYGRPIEGAIVLEDKALNTLENVAYIVNEHPEFFSSDAKLGVLSSDEHVARAAFIAGVLSGGKAPEEQFGAQEILSRRAEERGRDWYKEFAEFMRDEIANPGFVRSLEGEKRWMRGLTDPEFLRYWLGYIGRVENPAILQRVFQKLRDKKWVESAREAFSRVGIDFDHVTEMNFTELQEKRPEEYQRFREQLQQLTLPKHRALPPELSAERG